MKKLRGRSARELHIRGRQEISILGERFLGNRVGEMSDGQFRRCVRRSRRAGSALETAGLIAARIQDCVVFPSFAGRPQIDSIMEQRFPADRRAIIQRANRAIEGRFDLLGLKEVDFGCPPDWLLEPVSGRRASSDHWSRIDYLNYGMVGDHKIVWELNRHQHFVTLGQAYWLTGNEKYAVAFRTQAIAWMDQNPPERGINWASSLEIAFRSISWLWALHLFAKSPQITSRFSLRMMKYLIAHGAHIERYLSFYFSPNTHLTGEALALVYLGATLGEMSCAARWLKVGLQILIDQLPRQVRDDGVYFEQSFYYHRYTTDFYIHLLLLARASGIELPIEVEQKLEQLLTHLMWITRPDGSSPMVGDDDGGRLMILGDRRLDDFRDTLATGAALFGRSDWKLAAGDCPLETLWLLGPDGLARYDNLEPKASVETTRAFNSGGYYVMRDGWSRGSSYTLIDCSPNDRPGGAHAHASALSIEFAALGKTWLIDPGTFTYTANAHLRDRFRSSEAHNTVSIDSQSQSIPAGPFSWSHVAHSRLNKFIAARSFDHFEGAHDGYERLANPVRHTRSVTCIKSSDSSRDFAFMPSYLLVRDSFQTAGPHYYEIRYTISPGCSAFASGNRVVVTEPGGTRVNITVFGQPAVRARIIQTWVSRAYGNREPALVAVFDARGEGPHEFTSFILPAPADQAIRVDMRATGDTRARGFRVASEGISDLWLINDGMNLVNCGPLSATAEIACARFEEDAFSRAFLINGNALETSDGFLFRAAASVKHCTILQSKSAVECTVNDGPMIELPVGKAVTLIVTAGTSIELRQQTRGGAGDQMNLRETDSEAIG